MLEKMLVSSSSKVTPAGESRVEGNNVDKAHDNREGKGGRRNKHYSEKIVLHDLLSRVLSF